MTRPLDQGSLVAAIAFGCDPRERAQHVDRRVAAGLGGAPIEHDMAIEDRAHRIRERIAQIVALDQDREQAGDAARPWTGPARSNRRGSSANTLGG